ncbi:MAG: penicillin-binding protein 2 [Hyphomicrobiaceae bacterium]|nr:penicillin-binding protein 2 [Hyphomicrobiaceae bacterium]
MSHGIIITPGLAPRALNVPPVAAHDAGFPHLARRRAQLAIAATIVAFLGIAGQLTRLALLGQDRQTVSISAPLATGFARPDIVDRNGRLIAADVAMPSLYADPSIVINRDELVEKLARVLPDLDTAALRTSLADRSKRFVWIRRGLSPAVAEQVFHLGEPSLDFRYELRRSYPSGSRAGHLIGQVDIDNRGRSGLERHLDDKGLVEPVHGAAPSSRPPVRASLDIGVQHALEDELQAAMTRYRSQAASAVVLDAATGEVLAAASLPGVDPLNAGEFLDPARVDRLAGGSYELGSIMKAFTVAMAVDAGQAGLETRLDVSKPIEADGYTIKEKHAPDAPLTLAEILARSSNVGVGILALQAGAERQRAYFERFGLSQEITTEAGAVPAPRLPARRGDIETVTLSYGHGIAAAPLQVAAAMAALVNGGLRVSPTFLMRQPATTSSERILSPATSEAMRVMLRGVVTDPHGTGRKADVPGLDIGGKTGTAEMPKAGGYDKGKVIASFLAAFPMSAPRYVTLLSLFEPQGTDETKGEMTAYYNAAPATGRLISRIAPLLGVFPPRP